MGTLREHAKNNACMNLNLMANTDSMDDNFRYDQGAC